MASYPPLLFWKGETVKDIHPTTPITNIISKITGSPSRLWGVRRSINEVIPSGNTKQIQSVILPEPQNVPTELLGSEPNPQEKINNFIENNLHSLSGREDKFQSISGQQDIFHSLAGLYDNIQSQIYTSIGPKWPSLSSTGSHPANQCVSINFASFYSDEQFLHKLS